MPRPATWETADPAALVAPEATWQTGPRPAVASAEAVEGHETLGMEGRPTTARQFTPCPAWKKKLMMAGPAPINRAASPEISTARRPT